jgi:23S rRNA pseudouridine1911/1915/1917 synthase
MPEVIFENDDYLIINKPSGLVVHPGIGNTEHTLVNILIAQDMKLSSIDTNRPGIVHRLDKNTSGVMVIAKNDQFHSYISDRFANNGVNKKYHLLSDGKYKTARGIIEVPIGRDPHNRKLMKAQIDNSKEAKSIFRVIDSFKDNEYVEFKIVTGRTHQIRVHSKFIGAPVLNDPEYGKNTKDPEFGQYLHAAELSFETKDGEEVKYIATPPKQFSDKLNELRLIKEGE